MIKNVLNQLINENTTSLAGCPGCFCKRGNALNNILAMLGGWDQPLLHPLFLLHFCNVWLGGKWLYWSLRVGTHNPGVELQPKLQFLSKTFTTWILLLCEASPSPGALALWSSLICGEAGIRRFMQREKLFPPPGNKLGSINRMCPHWLAWKVLHCY